MNGIGLRGDATVPVLHTDLHVRGPVYGVFAAAALAVEVLYDLPA